MRVIAACFILVLGAAGCAALLPDAHVATQESWGSYDDAKTAIEAIVPYRTTRAELVAARIDPQVNASIAILTFPDIVQRFAVGGAVEPKALEQGIRDCLAAGRACSGYTVNIRVNRRDRIGNFWLDTFNFRRETDVTGWTFNATILLIEDSAVYRSYGGQPKVHEVELNRNPLGPLQGFGERFVPTVIGF